MMALLCLLVPPPPPPYVAFRERDVAIVSVSEPAVLEGRAWWNVAGPPTGDGRTYSIVGKIIEGDRVAWTVWNGAESIYQNGGAAKGQLDFNLDGFVNGIDFDQYVPHFEAGDRFADYDGNGFVNGDDFDAFTAAFQSVR